MKTLYFLILSTFLCLSMSCSGLFDLDDDQTPQDDCDIDLVVLTDDMQFGCRINGEPWKNKALNLLDEITGMPSLGADYRSDGFFFVSATRRIETPCDTINEYINVSVSNVNLGNNSISPLTYYRNRTILTTYDLDTLSNNNLYLESLDLENKTASGTFYFKAVSNNNPLDTLIVKDGRFNVSWIF